MGRVCQGVGQWLRRRSSCLAGGYYDDDYDYDCNYDYDYVIMMALHMFCSRCSFKTFSSYFHWLCFLCSLNSLWFDFELKNSNTTFYWTFSTGRRLSCGQCPRVFPSQCRCPGFTSPRFPTPSQFRCRSTFGNASNLDPTAPRIRCNLKGLKLSKILLLT